MGIAVMLVGGLGVAEMPVGLREAPWVVAVVVVPAGLVGAGLDAAGAVTVGVLDVDASADGGDVVGVRGGSDGVGARVRVGMSDRDGGRAGARRSARA